MRLPVILLALSLTLFTACSNGDAGKDAPVSTEVAEQDVDAAWADALQEAGIEGVEVSAVQKQAASDCLIGDEPSWIVALAVNPRSIEADAAKVGLELSCPEVVAPFEAALARVEKAADPKSLACSLPTSDLDITEQQTLKLVC